MNKKDIIQAKNINQSARGWYLLSQALDIAIKEMSKANDKHREDSNIADMKLLKKVIYNCPIISSEEIKEKLQEMKK